MVDCCELKINLKRLEADLLELSQIGHNSETNGVYRMAFTDADMEAREWLIQKAKKAGFYAKMDMAANVIIQQTDTPSSPVVTTGSHIDSVPCGGILDGCLGVLAGLECMRVIKENNLQTRYPLQTIAFSDEEGRFGGMFGVQAFCGDLTPDWLHNAVDADGVALTDVLEKHHFDPMKSLEAKAPLESIHSFIELHIEQGPVLEKNKNQIGIVEGISGVCKWMIRLIGNANHAGTSPMDMRNDAFMGMVDFAHEIPRILEENGTEKSRATIGKAELSPGFPHTIPGKAEFSLVFRDMSKSVMEALEEAFRKTLSAIARRHKLMFEYDEMSWLAPQECHSEIIELIDKHAQKLNVPYEHMPSGAGHDAQFMAKITKSGMIFVPSKGGISHAADEWTDWNDIEVGVNLLLQCLIDLSEVKPST